MLRSLLALLSAKPPARRFDTRSADDVLLYATIDPPKPRIGRSAGQQQEVNVEPVVVPTKPPANHHARLLSMRLDHARLCSVKRTKRLADAGIITVGDLVTEEPLQIAKRMSAPPKAEATLRRYQQAIRLAAAVDGLMPRDAMLLVAIHRRTVGALASESPALVYRDLERFALSTRGRRQLRGHRLPSLRRVRKWIDACVQSHVATMTVQAATNHRLAS